MKRFFAILLCCALSGAALAEDICRRLQGNTVLGDNPEALAILQEYLATMPAPQNKVVPIVCSGDGDAPFPTPTGIKDEDVGSTKYLLLWYDPRFHKELRSHLSAFIAHEMGHWSSLNPWACNWLSRANNRVGYIYCEHEVDVVGARWVGRQAIFNMLQAMIDRYRTFSKHEVVPLFRQIIIDNMTTRMCLLGKIDDDTIDLTKCPIPKRKGW